MTQGKPNSTSPELIEAVRDCARRKLSMKQAAAELSTPVHSLTRSAIAGIAGRAGIVFEAKNTNSGRASTPQPRKPYQPRTEPRAAFVIRGGQVKRPVPPKSECSWAGCTDTTEAGDMFCHTHARKSLL